MRHKAKFIATLFAGSTLIAAPAFATCNAGVCRGPAKTYNHNTMTQENAVPAPAARGSEGTSTMTTGSVGSFPGHLEMSKINSVKVAHVQNQGVSDTTLPAPAATNTSPQERRQIRAELAKSPKIMKQLHAKSISLSQIVAAKYDGGSTVTVWVK